MKIKVSKVFKSYPQGTEQLEILRGIDFTMEGSETVAIMGRSGCGKSTLISLLAGLDVPSSGQIEILGQDLKSLSGRSLNKFRAQHLGIVFQQFHLLSHLNAFENVRLPLDLARVEGSDERAHQMLQKVGLGHRGDHFPDALSRGECQRVAIARVLVMEPEILLADEPTGSLDLKTGREIIELIFQLVADRNIALVMATHDPRVGERCQRLLFMNEGQLASRRPAEFQQGWN